MFRSKPRSGASPFRANMWALKNKETGKLMTVWDSLCLPTEEGHEFPMTYYNRRAARMAKKDNYCVVKVAVTIRKAA